MSMVTRKDIARVVAVQLAAGKSSKTIAKQLAHYLVTERRSGELEAIIRDVQSIREEKEGITEATVTSAFPLATQTKTHIKKLLPGKTVIMNETLDPDVIGGVRIEAGSVLIDATLKRQLEQLKQGVN